MRFYKDGPSIPDELLNARDEGRVIFFCGAGVSRARAGLADFFGLADKVIAALGVESTNPAHGILREAREIEGRVGVGGLISADRVFGLLERDFLVSDIRAAVARALKPKRNVDLSAHRVLLDLAKAPNGKTRLVTTNFDRLFHDCDKSLKTWHPPYLPNPARAEELDGIIHLHGRATKNYSGAEADGFVLSSSEFGRAYLSEAWATEFFQQILARYVVVFVGYAADDPPVHYLLEALNTKGAKLTGVYAFQAGPASQATARWLHKGVEAIPYQEDNSHQALWQTLAAWALRAKSPEAWQRSVIEMARGGPAALEAHERGQVAHLVSTLQGAMMFSSAAPAPPAEWLCVFDPYRRYAEAGRLRSISGEGAFIDPFDLYGLDSDSVPSKADSKSKQHADRDAIQQAWNAFVFNRLDRLDLNDDNLPAFRGGRANTYAALPARLRHLGSWIARTSNAAACVWWAVHQEGLHADIVRQIENQLNHSEIEFSPNVRTAWQYLLGAWSQKMSDLGLQWYRLKIMLDKHGWSTTNVWEYAVISRPHIAVAPSFWREPTPPGSTEEATTRQLVDLDVAYGDELDEIVIPDEWLASVIRELRKNLEMAVDLEDEIGGYGLSDTTTWLSNEGKEEGRIFGLRARIAQYVALFERLIAIDMQAAKDELQTWPQKDDTLFARLRMWACAKPELVPAKECAILIERFSDSAFWDEYHQPDLLTVLIKRWGDLSKKDRMEITRRMVRGPTKTESPDEAEFAEYTAQSALNRLYWMASNGLELPINLPRESKKLRALAPNWTPADAAGAARSLTSSRSGWVKTETEHSALLVEPLSTLLTKALELSGRSADFLVENNPFAGLCETYPVRALNALTYAAKRGDFPEWAWRTFLTAKARKTDKPKFAALIACRLSSYGDEELARLIKPSSDWLYGQSERLATEFPDAFDQLVDRLLQALQRRPDVGSSGIVRGETGPDWVMEAINAPVGKIAQGLMNDPRRQVHSSSKRLNPQWLKHVEELIELHGDLRRHALVVFAYNMNWFYAYEPKWTEAKILSVLVQGDRSDQDSVWSGMFWAGKMPRASLFVRLKPFLLEFTAKSNWARRGYGETLAGIVLAGWGSVRPRRGQYISDAEMHAVLLKSGEEFRTQILWHLQTWSSRKDGAQQKMWEDKLLRLLRDVWPRQISAKTPSISGRLCDLAFRDPGRFPQVAQVILPLLTKIEMQHLVLPNLSQTGEAIAKQHPSQVLGLLTAVLPDDVRAWPFGIEAILEQIEKSDKALKADERLVELNRKWNAR